MASSNKTLQSKTMSLPVAVGEESESSLPRLNDCSSGTEGMDLIGRLTVPDVAQLKCAIYFPERLSEEYIRPAEFILSLDRWEKYDPELFLYALKAVRPDLVSLAERVNFLMNPPRPPEEKDEISRIMHGFVRELRDEITYTEWGLIFKTNGCGIGKEYDFQKISLSGYREEIITKDLQTLIINLGNVKRNRLAQTIESYRKKFSSLSDQVFRDKFMEQISKKQ